MTRRRRRRAREGVLPDFAVIGAMKAGTTALHDYLGQHPGVVTGSHKEIQYFTLYAHQPLSWYRDHFPTRAELAARQDAGGAPVRVGEASPYYLFHPAAPRRVRSALPEARFVVLLRNPVERAHSHYNHAVARGHERLSFEAALASEPRRLDGEAERLAADPAAISWAHIQFSYFIRGCYAEQLERWFACYPRDRFLVLFSDDFFADPASTTVRVQEFLGLEPQAPRDVAPVNARSYAGLDEGIRTHLADRYAEPDRRLAELLGRDLPWS
jgi:hypothetical protein